jgi:hypothetical protein
MQMASRTKGFALLGMACLLVLMGCGGFGQVNQGRVVEYDPAKGLVTLISEAFGQEASVMKYGVLPPVTIQVPQDPRQMGLAPKAGRLMSVDSQNRKVVVFDPATQSFKSIAFKLIEQRDGLFADDPAVKGAKLPKIDRAQKTITVYSPQQRQLVTFAVLDEYFDLPADTWAMGDEVRYYYKDPHKALRLMNVSSTGVL